MVRSLVPQHHLVFVASEFRTPLGLLTQPTCGFVSKCHPLPLRTWMVSTQPGHHKQHTHVELILSPNNAPPQLTKRSGGGGGLARTVSRRRPQAPRQAKVVVSGLGTSQPQGPSHLQTQTRRQQHKTKAGGAVSFPFRKPRKAQQVQVFNKELR